MLSDRECEILFGRLDEVLTEMEAEPWPSEERQRYLLRELNRIESTLDADVACPSPGYSASPYAFKRVNFVARTQTLVDPRMSLCSHQAQAHRHGITERTTFRDSVPHADVAALWPTIDVLVLPSHTTPRWAEQFGHVLVEAMAHGVAVVGASSGAIPDVIGDAGLVVPERDPAALREALNGLASDRSRVEELGHLGQTRVERLYTDDAVAERTIAFWKTLTETTARC